MNTLCAMLDLLSAAGLGVFAGAMLTEGLVLLPYWRSLAPTEFFAWYRANDRRLLAFFSPLTWLAGLLALAAAAISWWTASPGRTAALAAAALMVAAVSTFFVYFGRANASFASEAPDAAALPAELTRWGAWHKARTLLSLGALAAALIALRSTG